MRWRRNADEGMRRLEREAASGDPDAQLALDVARRRAGIPVLSDQITACAESVARNQEHGHHTILFPEVRSWRDLFSAEQPTSIDSDHPLPPELVGAGFRRVRDWLNSGVAEEMGLPAGGKLGVGEDEFSWSLKLDAPHGWVEPFPATEVVYPRRGRGPGREVSFSIPIGPSCYVTSAEGRWSLYVRATGAVYDAIRMNMLAAGANDAIDFAVTIRGEEEPRTALVSAKNNTIIGSRWLAVIPALEVPGP